MSQTSLENVFNEMFAAIDVCLTQCHPSPGLIRPLLYLTRRAKASRFLPSRDSFTQFYQSPHF
jgi:hypothetical protein